MTNTPRLAIRELTIKNFKALDELHLECPAPAFEGEPDVMVLGSENGLGKTSILQCIALLTLAPTLHRHGHLREMAHDLNLNLPDLLIRSGCDKAEITGKFQVGKKHAEQRLVISRHGELEFDEVPHLLKEVCSSPMKSSAETLLELLGLSSEPLLQGRLMFFHSYRRVQEGNPDLGSVMNGAPKKAFRDPRGPQRNAFSLFKMKILRLMMGQADLFEDVSSANEEGAFAELNRLVKIYAGGKIGKLRPEPDSSLDIRIQHLDRPDSSFSFDGLSSGQKEVISTLFLVGQLSSMSNAIVLIDEPELHLNAEWHAELVRQLFEVAPHNQYILASHSQQIFASVAPERRLLLAGG